MAIRIQLRRDTAANWVSANPTLRAGEVGIETDTLKFKIGNGTQTWTQITTYANVTPSSLTSSLSDYILAADQGTPGGPAELDSNGDLIIPENSIVLWNKAAYDYITTLTATQPTADRTITLPNATGTVALTSQLPTQYTDELAQDATATALAAGTHTNITVTYNDNANSISLAAAPGYVDEQAVDAVATALAAGTHTNITVGYNDSGNAISLTGAVTYTDENAQDAIGNSVGTGLSYNDSTGAISVDTSAIQARVTNVTDTEIGYLDGVTSAIQTQLNDKAPIASPTFTGTVAGITKSMVGLANVDNTTDAGKPVSTATQTALDLKAPIASPTFTGAVTLPGAPTSDLHAATKAYVDAATSGLNVHDSVKAATTENVNLNNGLEAGDTLDGVTLAHNDRVLVKNQNTASQNGIYIVQTNGAATRATDYDSTPEVDAGDFMFVEGGTVNGKTGWIQTNFITTIGTDPIAFSQFSGAGTYLAGNGLTLTGNSFSINTGTTADLSTAQTLTNKTLTSPKINEDVAVTATATELNILDGATLSTTELNYVDGVTSAIQTQLNAKAASADIAELAQDAVGTILSSDLAYNDSTPGIAINYVTVGNTLLDGVSGSSYGLIGTSTYLDVKNTNGYNKEIELDIAAVKTQLNTDGYLTTSSTSTLTNKTLTSPKINEDVAVTATATELNILDGATLSTTELNYVDGVTSAIQTQLDAKVDESLFDTKGDILVASADNTPAKLAAGTNGYLLTANSAATNGIEWAAAPVSLPSQTDNSGKFLTTDGSTASWASLPITTFQSKVNSNSETTIDTVPLSAFTGLEYVITILQGTKVRTSKVLVQTDGTSVDMTEYAITETGGAISGIVIAAAVASSNMTLKATVTDGATTTAFIKLTRTLNLVILPPVVTGGTLSSDSTYYYRTFTSSGSLAISNSSLPVEALVVAGGGGGGASESGAGAGGVLAGSLILSPTTHTITIGSGGSSSTNGNNSSIGSTLVSIGGGGSSSGVGKSGGSGSGGANGNWDSGGTGGEYGSGTANQGFRGGTGLALGSFRIGGGGGGAGGVGYTGRGLTDENAGDWGNNPNFGDGGIGATYNTLIGGTAGPYSFINAMGSATSTGELSSTNYYYAGGGSSYAGSFGSGVSNPGGLGGGGAGGNISAGGSGSANTGGGAGSGSSSGGTGGSGVVIVRYLKSAVD